MGCCAQLTKSVILYLNVQQDKRQGHHVIHTHTWPSTFLVPWNKSHKSPLGYSRKNPHPQDGWQDFLTPSSTRISRTTRSPLLPGFPSPKTPLPPGFPLISLEALILIESQWKRRKITFRRFFWLFLKTLVNIFAKLISIINKLYLRTHHVRESLLVLKCHLFVFYTTPNTQD